MPKQFHRFERLTNWMLGISFFGWAIMGLVQPEDAGSLVRWCIAALHISAALLVIFRAPAIRQSGIAEICLCFPGIISAGLVFACSQSTDHWSGLANGLFLAGTAGAIGSLFFLGRNFAIFPATRDITILGPYRFVRHPVYFCESLLLIACLVAGSTPWVWAAFIGAMGTIILRILVEENHLMKEEAYRQFATRVTKRLVPFIW